MARPEIHITSQSTSTLVEQPDCCASSAGSSSSVADCCAAYSSFDSVPGSLALRQTVRTLAWPFRVWFASSPCRVQLQFPSSPPQNSAWRLRLSTPQRHRYFRSSKRRGIESILNRIIFWIILRQGRTISTCTYRYRLDLVL